jgi:hypothetical protein
MCLHFVTSLGVVDVHVRAAVGWRPPSFFVCTAEYHASALLWGDGIACNQGEYLLINKNKEPRTSDARLRTFSRLSSDVR